MMKSSRISITLALALFFTTGCNTSDSPLPLVGTLERDQISVSAEARERIIAIRVTEGDLVERGDTLVILDTRLLETTLQEARAIRDRERQRLAEVRRGPRSEKIREAEANLNGADRHLAIQQREFDRISEMVSKKLLSESDLDAASDLLSAAQSRREESAARLADLQLGSTSEELGQARASLAAAAASVSRLETEIEKLTVTAASAGRIESLPFEVGETPPVGATLAIMQADTPPYARVYVPQPLRGRVTPGESAIVNVDGFDPFEATVRFVSSEAAFTPYYALTQRDRSRLVYLAEIVLDNPGSSSLPSGLPVEVDFPSLSE